MEERKKGKSVLERQKEKQCAVGEKERKRNNVQLETQNERLCEREQERVEMGG